MIQQRWKSARDAYRRDKSKLSTLKSGQAAKTYKKYIYYENLNFLNKTLELNETDTNFMEESQNAEDMSEVEDPVNESVDEEERVNTKTNKRKRKQDIDEKLMEFLNNSKKSEDNGHRAFLESLLPTLNTFDEVKSLQFRAEVLRIMMEIKNIPIISQMYTARNNSQIRDISNQRPVSYSQYNVNPSSLAFHYANSNYPQSLSNSATGYSDINSRPQSRVSYVSSPLSSNNEYGYTQNHPPQDYSPIDIQPDEMDRPTLLELTGIQK